MAEYNAVLIGSGINSLVAGAMLARAGWRDCVQERDDKLGGIIKIDEITEPGFHHAYGFINRHEFDRNERRK